MDKDTLKEFESLFVELQANHDERELILIRVKKILEKMQERERLLGITREVEDFEK